MMSRLRLGPCLTLEVENLSSKNEKWDTQIVVTWFSLWKHYGFYSKSHQIREVRNETKEYLASVWPCSQLLLGVCSSNVSDPGLDNWASMRRKQITICLIILFVPMGIWTKISYAGFDIDLANVSFLRIWIKVKWQPIDWDKKETELTTARLTLSEWLFRDGWEKGEFHHSLYEKWAVVLPAKSSHISLRPVVWGRKGQCSSRIFYMSFFESNPEIFETIVKNHTSDSVPEFNEALIILVKWPIDGLWLTVFMPIIIWQKTPHLDQYSVFPLDLIARTSCGRGDRA